MSTLLRDIRFAVRSLRKSPGMLFVIVASLGLGIGAMTTAYTWIDSFLLRPFPAVRETNRLVGVFTRGPQDAEWSISYPRYQKFRDQTRALEAVAVHASDAVSLKTGTDAPERVFAELVSGNFFELLGVRASLGRTFLPDEEAKAAPVAVLAQSYWQRRFAADPGIVGQKVLLNGQGFTVIGIAPSGFGGTEVGLGFDLWVPVTTRPLLSPGNRSLTQEGNQWLDGIARLAPGVSFDLARTELETITTRISTQAGQSPVLPQSIRRLSDSAAGRLLGPMFYTLFGVGVLILLIASANVANLLVVRAIARTREVSVRLAVGAGRARIVRQLLTESVILAMAGGVAGLALAYAGRGVLQSLIPPLPFPVSLEARVSPRVIGLAAVVSLGTAVLFGLLPALRASRPALLPALKDEVIPGSSRSLGRSALVVAQVAFALVALVSAGLFLRSATKARSADPGFTNADRVLVAETDFRLAGIQGSAAGPTRDQLLRVIKEVPGVIDVSLTTDIPMSLSNNSSTGLEVQDYTPARDENMSVGNGIVGPNYFEILGIPIRKGRGFTEADRSDGAPVIVVNEAMNRRFWPGQDPIGKRVRVDGTWHTVVGLVGNVKMSNIGETPFAYFYRAHAQSFDPAFTLVVKTRGAPMTVAEPIRKAFEAVNSNLPMLDARSMRQSMAGALFIQSAGATLLTGLGAVALGLAAIGLFGVLSYVVGLRHREIGIRMALGAEVRAVVGLVMRQAVGLIGIGLAIGLALAILVGRLLRGQLFGVSPSDPVTFGVITAVILLVGVLASVAPARRAAGVQPIRVLKE